MNGLIDFQCEVYESGYEFGYIEIGEFQDGKFVAMSDLREAFPVRPNPTFISFIKPIDPNSTKRIFNLMDHPGAYNEFASITTDMHLWPAGKNCVDYYIEFANKYGLLTCPSSSIQDEDMSIWSHHMIKMRIAIRSLADIKKGKVRLLNCLFRKDGDHFKVRVVPDIFLPDDIFESPDYSDYDMYDIPTIGQTPPRNSTEAAYHYICDVVNKNLNDSLVTEIVANRTNSGVSMTVRPKDLISALWLQLAHAVSRNLEFKQCAACSTFFEVKTPKRRFERIYCSDKCGKRVYARNRRAKEKAK